MPDFFKFSSVGKCQDNHKNDYCNRIIVWEKLYIKPPLRVAFLKSSLLFFRL